MFVGGQQLSKPIYRVTVTIPEGAPGAFGPLAARGREKFVKRVTEAVLSAEGSENTMVEAHRVWVHLRQIADGHWAGCGEVSSLADLAAYGSSLTEPTAVLTAYARPRWSPSGRDQSVSTMTRQVASCASSPSRSTALPGGIPLADEPLDVALSGAGSGEFVFAQVSAGKAAALRAALRRGFQPICAEYLVR